jgi:hypothetical protein
MSKLQLWNEISKLSLKQVQQIALQGNTREIFPTVTDRQITTIENICSTIFSELIENG